MTPAETPPAAAEKDKFEFKFEFKFECKFRLKTEKTEKTGLSLTDCCPNAHPARQRAIEVHLITEKVSKKVL